MNEKPKETRARVYLRRAVLAALDAAIVAFSFYFALLLRADGAVEAAWWPHNLAILYHNLPWIVAVYVASFCWAGCTRCCGSTRASATCCALRS